MEIGAQIAGKAVDVPAELQQRVLGGATGEGPDGRPNRLGLGPPALAGPGVEPVEVPFVQVHL